MKVGYKENEWLVVYVDENGDRQHEVFNEYEQADKFVHRIRDTHNISLIGIMTTRFYNHYVESIIEQ